MGDFSRCHRCGLSEFRLFAVGFYRADGVDEGVHLVDHELRLCHSCVPIVIDQLGQFIRDQGGEVAI